MSNAHAAPYGKSPKMVVLDDVEPTYIPRLSIHPVLRVRPITKSIWNIYGPPPLARWMLKMAFDEILTLEETIARQFSKTTKRR